MGMLALSVDVGNLMFERRQLQNGADATALALANDCAADGAHCAPEQVKDLLNENAADGFSQFDKRADAPDGACQRAVPDSGLPQCDSADHDASMSDLAECPPLPNSLRVNSGIPYVETYSRTETKDHSALLPSFFGQFLTGSSTNGTVSACARAAFGALRSHTATVPITFSTCEWDEQTDGGRNYVTRLPVGKPGYGTVDNPWPAAGEQVVIKLHEPRPNGGKPDCVWNGKDSPGGFGYLMSDGNSCEASVTTDGWVSLKPGNDNKCPQISELIGTVVALPVFDCIIPQKDQPVGPIPVGTNCDPTKPESNGKNQWYHIKGWASFYLAGYKLSGNDSGTSLRDPNTVVCSGSERCLIGWYVKGTLSTSLDDIVSPGSDGDFGLTGVSLAG